MDNAVFCPSLATSLKWMLCIMTLTVACQVSKGYSIGAILCAEMVTWQCAGAPAFLAHVPILGGALRGICVRAVKRMVEVSCRFHCPQVPSHLMMGMLSAWRSSPSTC